MTGNEVAPRRAEILENLVNRGGDRQDRRLRVLRQLQLIFRTFETEFGNRDTECLIDFVEDAACRRIFFRDVAPHAGVLASLPRKNEGGVVLHRGANSSLTWSRLSVGSAPAESRRYVEASTLLSCSRA